MSAKLDTRESSTQSMLCPCCGDKVIRVARECGCGARFVGEPLDETPIKVQRLGPAMVSVVLLLTVVGGALVATKWISIAGVVVMWASWRALQRARHNAEWYGGKRTAMATFSLTVLASVALAAYGISYIPKAIENYRVRQIAATQASMHHVASLLEDYKLKIGRGSYPSQQEFRKILGDSLPMDYWESSIKYQPGTDRMADTGIADTGIGTMFSANTGIGIPFSVTNFELRSAGPDGVTGNDDDIIMRDGMFFTNAQVKKQTVVQQLR